ncbi:MAG: Conserved TM helix [Phormidesmis priestleyi Ana]|uniref:Conserved TM helix n=1 Tax=Phormidesmis priestleyi Ana TaxID=1666911 RepID=A0A0P8BMB2_9CYAN|nr:MAG: Conserved TM helix [Phormidesmis priestleyi Ana]
MSPPIGDRLPGLEPPSYLAQVTTREFDPGALGERFTGLFPAGSLGTLIGAALFLILGFIVAAIAAWIVRSLLNKTDVDERIAASISGSGTNTINLAKWISTAVFWTIGLFAVIGFLNALQLTSVSDPLTSLLDTVLQYIPRIFSAGILLAVAWVIATIVRTLVNRFLEGFDLDERLAENTGVDPRENSIKIHETLGNALYWFIFLLFLPAILGALALEGLLDPVQGLLDQFLSAIPQIITAIIIFAIGWLIAKIVRGIVTNLLAASGIDGLGSRLGLSSSTVPGSGLSLSGLVGTIAYVFILIPVAIAALQELDIAAISVPAVSMLNQVLDFIPLLLAAGVVLTVFYFIGKFVSELVTSVLESAGFDSVLGILGLPDMAPPTSEPTTPPPAAYDPNMAGTTGIQPGSTVIQPSSYSSSTSTSTSSSKSPSEIAGLVVLVGIVLFGLVTATEILQLDQLTDIVTAVLGIAAQVLVGVVIFAIGLYIANLAYRVIKAGGSSGMLAQSARVVILAFVGALALAQMGVAPNIVNLAFGLLLGAVAVAIAIAFGLGGRDVAGKQLQEWLNELKR